MCMRNLNFNWFKKKMQYIILSLEMIEQLTLKGVHSRSFLGLRGLYAMFCSSVEQRNLACGGGGFT